MQTFHLAVAADAVPASVVQLEVLDNHGEADYTCLYRFRVHGEIVDS